MCNPRVVLVTIAGLIGCSDSASDFEARRAYSLDRHRLDGASRTATLEQSKETLRLLADTTPESAETPRLVCAEASIRPEKGLVHGTWIAFAPRADAIKIEYDDREAVIRFTDWTVDVHKHEHQGLVFSFAEVVDPESDVYSMVLGAWENRKPIRAQLLLDGEALGTPCPIHLARFHDGRWEERGMASP